MTDKLTLLQNKRQIIKTDCRFHFILWINPDNTRMGEDKRYLNQGWSFGEEKENVSVWIVSVAHWRIKLVFLSCLTD